MSSQPSQVSVLLGNLQKGDPKAASRLLPIVYDELRRLAAYYMRGEKPGQSIQATELVHEAYLRLVGQERIEWQGRSHFFAMAATAMRRILVDRARRKMAEKHGGGGKNPIGRGARLFSRKIERNDRSGRRSQASRRDIASAVLPFPAQPWQTPPRWDASRCGGRNRKGTLAPPAAKNAEGSVSSETAG